MKLNTLKIDLDVRTRKKALNMVSDRISYFNNVFKVPLSYWGKIELIKKTRYSCKITLSKNMKDEKNIIIFQLLFGSDWQKEVNTFYNSNVLKMDYSNRMFDIKNYDDKFKTAIKEDVTSIVLENVKSPRILNLRRVIKSKIERFFKC